jgi:hypothetical protein
MTIVDSNVLGLDHLHRWLQEACDLRTRLGMSRVLLKLAKRSLPLMILRDFELLVKIPIIRVIRFV